MAETADIIKLIHAGTPMVALVAPSFPVMYTYPDIIGRLRRLGFSKVIEVSVGAVKTNEALVNAYRKDPNARYITSPCASFVRLVRRKYPHLEQYLTSGVDSPMVAAAKITAAKFPRHRPVFIGPCIAKKMEAKEDHPELGITVLSYLELESLFAIFGTGTEPGDETERFDLEASETRSYPADGGLTETSGIRKLLKQEEIRIVSGYKNCETALTEFENNPAIRLLDILFCEGGCISGPGIAGTLSVAERKKRIEAYAMR